MDCDDRPQGEACNCCGDAELRSLIQGLSDRIRNNETTIGELQNRVIPLPNYTDCGGGAIASNATLATCTDLQLAISGIKIPDIPDIPDITGLSGRISQLESDIGKLNTLISNLNTLITNPGRDNNFGGRVDQATIDGLAQQIQNISNQFTNINRKLDASSTCCEEVKAEIEKLKQNGGGGGGDCDYNGWTVDASSRRIQYNDPDYGRRFEAVINGPKLKSVTIMSTNGYQRAIVTDDSGRAQISWEEQRTGINGSYSGVVRLIHCGREVASTNVFHG